MTDDLPIHDTLTLPGWELWVTTSRSSGAGGQHVNRTESRVTLHWNLAGSSVLTDAQRARLLQRLGGRVNADGVLQVSVETHRSQHRNREEARERLQALVVEALQTRRARRATRPTRSSVRRRLEAKRQQGEKKERRRKPDPTD